MKVRSVPRLPAQKRCRTEVEASQWLEPAQLRTVIIDWGARAEANLAARDGPEVESQREEELVIDGRDVQPRLTARQSPCVVSEGRPTHNIAQ